MWVWPNHLVNGHTSPLKVQNLLKVAYRLNMPWRMFSPCLDHWMSVTEQCLSIECIHWEGPLHKRYSIRCSSLGYVIVTIRSSSSFPPSLRLLVDKGPFCCPVRLCLCVWMWENFLTVRESPPLSGLAFPLGSSRLREAEPHHSSKALLRPATPSGSHARRNSLPCLLSPNLLVWAVCVTSPCSTAQFIFSEGGDLSGFSAQR